MDTKRIISYGTSLELHQGFDPLLFIGVIKLFFAIGILAFFKATNYLFCNKRSALYTGTGMYLNTFGLLLRLLYPGWRANTTEM